MKPDLIELLQTHYTTKNSSKEYTEMMSQLNPYLNRMTNGEMFKLNETARTITLQVTEACNLECSYCYQINKSPARMSIETAKKFIDFILSDDTDKNPYINKYNTDTIILDFIGGEPFLEIDLIDETVDYFIKRCIELNHPWLYSYMISVGSNGTLYQTEKVQKFLNKHLRRLSLNITVDGDKTLHDSCRVFPDGSGSYDLAAFAATDWMRRTNGASKSTKLTIAPGNIKYLKDAIINMINLGFDHINENCVYEDVWNIDYAKELYRQLKDIADYILDNNLEKKVDLRIFNPTSYTMISPDFNKNWCGGDGSMLACDPDGNLYNCIRYMKSSLGDSRKPLIIGNINDGIAQIQEHKDNLQCMRCVTRYSQSEEKCYWCPIGQGCGWCSAYNYQFYGTVNKRTTTTCQMHIAASLASNYYWNKLLSKIEYEDRLKLNTPKDWALDIISEDEYNIIRELAKSDPIYSKDWYANNIKPIRIFEDGSVKIL